MFRAGMIVVLCYLAGFGCMRVVGKNSAYGHDRYDDPDTTYFCDRFAVTRSLYYLYLPLLEVDRRVTGRQYCLTDTWD